MKPPKSNAGWPRMHSTSFYLSPDDLRRAGRIANRSYSFNEIDELLDLAEAMQRHLAQAYAHWSSTITTLRGEKATGMLEDEIPLKQSARRASATPRQLSTFKARTLGQ